MPSTRGRFDWTAMGFLAVIHLVAVGGSILYGVLHGITGVAVGIAIAWFLLTGLSITAGYHRLFAHGSYRGHGAVRAFLLFFGAGAFQQPVLKWASDHRRHHSFVDEKDDPYSIRRGFWWAHMGWLFFQDADREKIRRVEDLQRDRLVLLQYDYYLPLALFVCFAMPALVGFLLGDAWGGLLLGGFARLAICYHATWSVNSVAHTLGTQPYSDRNSSRDSFVTALVSLGEGYHNFHHAFPFDYRNGICPYHLDPSKWFIRALQFLGLTTDLVRTPHDVILKARIRMQGRRAEARLHQAPRAAEILRAARVKVEAYLDQWATLKAQLHDLRARTGARSREALRRLKEEIRLGRARFRDAYRAWVWALRRPHLAVALVG